MKALKKKIARYILQKEALQSRKQQREAVAYSKAVKIGIVFNATEAADRKLVEQLREQLNREGKEVAVYGFVDAKEFPQELVFKPGTDFFNRKNIRWTGIPQQATADVITSLPLDYFIGLFSGNEIPLLYLAARTKAKYRIGLYNEQNTQFFDFMIDLKNDPPLKKLIETTLHYLKNLRA